MSENKEAIKDKKNENSVTLTVDGVEVSVPTGTKLIEATKKAKSHVPYFCYHPGLSIAAQCRMCFVEIEGMPKLATACSTPVSEGMVVKTDSEKVKSGQNSTLEFTLLNHPLDCPICDRGGECKLQDYTYTYGLPNSRLTDEKRDLDKARSLGNTIVLDQERCILCTRCVRFSAEVDGRTQLVVNNRGSENVIDVFEDRPFESPYTGNVVDLCPVGALTAKDYRFAARPWELVKHDGVCTGCSNGCNVEFHTKHRHPGIERPDHLPPSPKLLRLVPRKNEDINQWWICDKGRWGYHFHNELEKRLQVPMISRRSGGEQTKVSLKELQLKIQEICEEDVDTKDKAWEFWVSDNTSHEEISWAKEIFASWNERGRKIKGINSSPWSDRFMEYWKTRSPSPWFAGQVNWDEITEVVSPWESYTDLESVLPLVALKLGQRLRQVNDLAALEWTRKEWDSLSKLKASDNRAWIVPVPRTEDELAAIEKIDPKAKVLIAWTAPNSRGLLNEGIAPVELQSQFLKGKTPKGPVFYFGQTNQSPMDVTFEYYLNQAKSLVVADSFESKLSKEADVVLPLNPLYESKIHMTSVENFRQYSNGVELKSPNTPSIRRGGEVLNPSLRLL